MKFNRFAALSAALMAMLVSGCAWTPHDVQVATTAPTPVSTVGSGTHLYFQFVDDRDDVTVGHRGVATVGAKITAADVPQVVEKHLRTMLQNKGYTLLDGPVGSDAGVTYRLRAFKFEIESGLFTGGQNADVVLAVDASRALDASHGAQTYKTVYRSNSEERILAVPDGDAIDQQLNAALTDVLTKAANDTALDSVLTGH
jgi:uncharacterized lipoprotein YajG